MRNIEQIIQFLASSNPTTRAHAARALGEIAYPNAIELLIKALYDLEAIVRENAARSLGAIGDLRAIEPLLDMVTDADRREQPDVDGDLSNIEMDAMTKIAKRVGTPAVDLLIALLNKHKSPHRNQNRVGYLIAVLGEVGNSSAVDAIIAFLEDETIHTNKFAAISALGRIGDPRAIPILEKWASNQKHIVFHDWAKEAIKKIQEKHQKIIEN